MTLSPGKNYLQAAVIDPVGDYAYFSAGTGSGYIIQIDLAALTRTTALTLGDAEYGLIGAAVDLAGQYAYFAAFNVPGRVVKIELGAAGGGQLYLPIVVK